MRRGTAAISRRYMKNTPQISPQTSASITNTIHDCGALSKTKWV